MHCLKKCLSWAMRINRQSPCVSAACLQASWLSALTTPLMAVRIRSASPSYTALRYAHGPQPRFRSRLHLAVALEATGRIPQTFVPLFETLSPPHTWTCARVPQSSRRWATSAGRFRYTRPRHAVSHVCCPTTENLLMCFSCTVLVLRARVPALW